MDKGNRWVNLAHSIPWDMIVPYYDKLFHSTEGCPPISGRVILGSIFIKHLGDLSDRETIAQIQENMFMQYFLATVAIGRKSYLFAGNYEAAQRSAMLYSLNATCKLHNVNPIEWLTNDFENINDHK